MESSSSASFKRARAPATGNQVPSCLVDGCTADLSKCRDYHRRHKVCEVHSKTPKVTIRGQEQRFCQQCSRFHSLVEFDEVKRSCRKRLDGHNRRRRKAQPDFMSVNSGRFPYNHQGTRYFPIGSSQMHSWMGGVKVESDMKLINFSGGNSLFLDSHLITTTKEKSISHSYKPPLHHTLEVVPFVNRFSRRRAVVTTAGKMFSDELNQAIDSDRALSLLSSQPAETREIGLSPMVQPASASFFIPNLQFNDVGGTGGEPVGTAILDADGEGHEMFQNEHLGSSATGAHHTLSFSWE